MTLKINLPALAPVLFLDDEVEVLNAIERELRGIVEIVKCTQVSQALEQISKNEFSGIVSDLKLPDSSGVEFLSKCCSLKPEIPRMLLTAFSDLANIQETINSAQVSRILGKPWKKEDLIRSIEGLQTQYELYQENQILRTLTLTDSLTGLANHRYFWERLESEFSRSKRFKRTLSLIMGDVDDFKKINDSEGHPRGDSILKQIAKILNAEKRNMDTVARYGGEEFAMILPEASGAQAVEIAKRRLEVLLKAQAPSMSFGVAEINEHCETPQQLYEQADKALYQAKALGKSCVVQWSPLKAKH